MSETSSKEFRKLRNFMRTHKAGVWIGGQVPTFAKLKPVDGRNLLHLDGRNEEF